MYENGEPFFEIRNIVKLRERILSNFDTCMKVFMNFINDCSKHSERKTDSDSIAYDIWRRGSIKSCENLLYNASKKGVPVMRG